MNPAQRRIWRGCGAQRRGAQGPPGGRHDLILHPVAGPPRPVRARPAIRGIVAQDDGAQKVIFRDRCASPGDNPARCPAPRMPYGRDSADELLFRHNKQHPRGHVRPIRHAGPAARLRDGEDLAMAAEAAAWSIPAVPDTGIVVVGEHRRGGREGCYDMVTTAQKLADERQRPDRQGLAALYRLVGSGDEYRMDPAGVAITDGIHLRFGRHRAGHALQDRPRPAPGGSPGPATRASSGSVPEDVAGVPWHPGRGDFRCRARATTPRDMIALRKRGGIRRFRSWTLPVQHVLGRGAIRRHGHLAAPGAPGEHRFLATSKRKRAPGLLRAHVAGVQEAHGPLVWGKHFLPHDAAHQRLSDTCKTLEEQLNDLGLVGTVIVPVITQLINGIEMVHQNLKAAFFDRERTARASSGWTATARWSQKDQCFIDAPNKRNGCSEGR